MKYLFILVAAVLLTGCLEPDAVRTKPEDAQSLVDHITYVKDKHGICYAVVSVVRVSTRGGFAENIMMAAVPCDKVGL